MDQKSDIIIRTKRPQASLRLLPININNVYFPVQVALDGSMISPVFISNNIVKWFPERAAFSEMLKSFVEKEN